ncbi:MAG: hypothetical protein GF334_00255 [Candidatus Altiarchaeales archaeon]|nr:hypothetical protein [Candidatus Altiarchaeales archaeon]
MITLDQMKALFGKIDSLQEAGVEVQNVEFHQAFDELFVYIAAVGKPGIEITSDDTRFKITKDANIKPQTRNFWVQGD